jgi:hypothetical protein
MFRRYRLWIGLMAVCPALTAFCNPCQAAGQRDGLPWWAWVLIILVALALLALLLWWLLCRRREERVPAAEVEAPAPPPAAAPPAPDDLERIEGIGPKIAGLLQAADITTFAQLAVTDVGRLERIVREAGITIADPTTWPEQARLAAAGRWDELEVLQEELKGGRRV